MAKTKKKGRIFQEWIYRIEEGLGRELSEAEKDKEFRIMAGDID